MSVLPLRALAALWLICGAGTSPCSALGADGIGEDSVDVGILKPGVPSKWNNYAVWFPGLVGLEILDTPRVKAHGTMLNEFISKNQIDVAAQFANALLIKIKSKGITAIVVDVPRKHESTGGAIDRAEIPSNLQVRRLIDPSFQYLLFFDPTIRPAALAMSLRVRFLSRDGLPEDLPLSVFYNDPPYPPGTTAPKSGTHLRVVPITQDCRFSTYESLLADLGAFQACLKGALDAMAESVANEISK